MWLVRLLLNYVGRAKKMHTGVFEMITKEQKAEIIAEYGDSPNDTGKSEVQIALLSARITHLTGHLIANKKDHHTRRGLIMLVNKRRRLLNYLVKTDIARYRVIILALKLRK